MSNFISLISITVIFIVQVHSVQDIVNAYKLEDEFLKNFHRKKLMTWSSVVWMMEGGPRENLRKLRLKLKSICCNSISLSRISAKHVGIAGLEGVVGAADNFVETFQVSFQEAEVILQQDIKIRVADPENKNADLVLCKMSRRKYEGNDPMKINQRFDYYLMKDYYVLKMDPRDGRAYLIDKTNVRTGNLLLNNYLELISYSGTGDLFIEKEY